MLQTSPGSWIANLFGFTLVCLSKVRNGGKLAFTNWLVAFGLMTSSGASSANLASCSSRWPFIYFQLCFQISGWTGQELEEVTEAHPIPRCYQDSNHQSVNHFWSTDPASLDHCATALPIYIILQLDNTLTGGLSYQTSILKFHKIMVRNMDFKFSFPWHVFCLLMVCMHLSMVTDITSF